ncbi:MAG: ATP-binding cassette domain-containing protein [Treponema sp.]|nr:ATP-binding cassette domain-containing protein [Treponema sp.]
MEIILDNLVKTYKGINDSCDVTAVKGVSLHIPSNKIFGIIGKSGAGKSSLVRLVSLLETPDSGCVMYDDKRVDNLVGKDLLLQRRKLGMIFQNFNLFSSRTAGQNIAYPMEICGFSKKQIDVRVDEMLELVGLSDKKNAPVSTLSGGQKQRIAIARALSTKPDVLFCDEATSALDPQTTKSILSLIRKIQERMNLTVVMITHQMEVVRDACNLVAVLNDGEVVEQGSVDDIFIHPKSEVTKDFLANISQNQKADNQFVRWSKNGGKYILRFTGHLTGEPILSQMAKKFDVEFNIRAGGIQALPENKVGTLVTDILGTNDEIQKAISYLNEQGVIVELDSGV